VSVRYVIFGSRSSVDPHLRAGHASADRRSVDMVPWGSEGGPQSAGGYGVGQGLDVPLEDGAPFFRRSNGGSPDHAG
jgi:hypothetical protein